MLPNANNQKTEYDLTDLSPKRNQKVLMKIEEMADIFLNLANFVPHALLTLAIPSSYFLNLKVLIKVSKVSWTSQFSYEMLRFSFERKFDKTNFISPQKPSQKPAFFRVNHICSLDKYPLYTSMYPKIRQWYPISIPSLPISYFFRHDGFRRKRHIPLPFLFRF